MLQVTRRWRAGEYSFRQKARRALRVIGGGVAANKLAAGHPAGLPHSPVQEH